MEKAPANQGAWNGRAVRRRAYEPLGVLVVIDWRASPPNAAHTRDMHRLRNGVRHLPVDLLVVLLHIMHQHSLRHLALGDHMRTALAGQLRGQHCLACKTNVR